MAAPPPPPPPPADPSYAVALTAFGLGSLFSLSLLAALPLLPSIPKVAALAGNLLPTPPLAAYLAAWTFFHLMEYVVTAVWNPNKVDYACESSRSLPFPRPIPQHLLSNNHICRLLPPT